MDLPAQRRLLLLTAAAFASACYDFHLTGPEDAPPVPSVALVSVSVEYRQPNGCLGAGSSCEGPPIFFASWMQKGAEFPLTRDPGTFIWRGVARNVPVNYPPRDAPYEVRVNDPYLRESCAQGYTSDRIVLGGELLTRWDGGGCANQHALAYVDQNGLGHNPY